MPEVKEIIESKFESVVNSNSVESRHIIDIDQKSEVIVPREVKSFLQKIEEAPQATPTFDPSGQPQLSPATPTNPKIILPITRTTFLDGFKKSFDDVGFWLSHFFFREIKLKESQVIFKSPNDS